MTTQNLSCIFKKIPTGFPKPGEDLVIEDRPIDLSAAIPDHSVLLEHLHSSLDPYIRNRMRPAHIKSYAPAFNLNEPIDSLGIARVLKSTSPDFSQDEIVVGNINISQYSIKNIALNNRWPRVYRLRKISNPHNLDLRLFTGPLGMAGLTAYSSFYEIGQPKRGETIFISSAAGAVGQIVGQLAKREGLKVIGSVGSDEKLSLITKELEFDGGFNYKTEGPDAALRRLAPDGIDIYYENVGGEHLGAALNAFNNFGRIVACGMISDYNRAWPDKYPIRNLSLLISKRLTMRGFIVSDEQFSDKYFEPHIDNVSKWLADGEFKVKMALMGTIETADKALVAMLEGKNLGKAVLDCQIAGASSGAVTQQAKI